MQGYRDNRILEVRSQFTDLLLREQFVIDKTGVKTIEIVGADFIADEPLIFGEVNEDYVSRELEWYQSMSRNVNDIPGGPPKIWQQIASKEIIPELNTERVGYINSNYGFILYSAENFYQWRNVIEELKKNPLSRRALAIYNRPSMHEDYNKGGMSDFVCTNAVQYLIRDGLLDVVVQMRSNDVWAGYRNDYAWQRHVQHNMVDVLNQSFGGELDAGTIHWQVGSLHCYEKDFYLVDHYDKTGQISIKKSEYREKYPESPWK
jgi:thymidylate synthase